MHVWQDEEAETAMTLLSDCDKAGRELMASIEQNIPEYNVDVSASDTETGKHQFNNYICSLLILCTSPTYHSNVYFITF